MSNQLLLNLHSLGLRKTGDFTLCSGIKSDVFWDIMEMFEYPRWIALEAIREFVWKIGLFKPRSLVGIQTGGFQLSLLISECLGITVLDSQSTYLTYPKPVVIVDDVLTTGNTVRAQLGYWRGKGTVAVAVLVNRSKLLQIDGRIDGMPLISGVMTDLVGV